MKMKYVPLYAALTALAALIAAHPETYVPACFEGIALWAKCVLPALFPFMVITLLMIKTGGAELAARPFGRACGRIGLPREAAAIAVMSAFSGYPAGSRIVCEYCESGRISRTDARRLAPLCSAAGPAFLLGSVGQNMFGDRGAGAAIMCAHLASVAATGVALCLATRRTDDKISAPPAVTGNENALYDAFFSAVISVAVAGGFICFFYTMAEAAEQLGLTGALSRALEPALGSAADGLCRGLIEPTGGCAALAAGGSPLALPLAGFLITFGGASILLQQLCYLVKCGVSPARFVAAKLVQGALCFVLLLPSVAA